jgi:predicted ABC-type exoprotein transport system permease subunit
VSFCCHTLRESFVKHIFHVINIIYCEIGYSVSIFYMVCVETCSLSHIIFVLALKPGVITSLGFGQAKSDMSLFIFWRGTNTVYLLLYVDDIVLAASSVEILQHTISTLKWEFTMKDLEPHHHFLGVSVQDQADMLFLTQR